MTNCTFNPIRFLEGRRRGILRACHGLYCSDGEQQQDSVLVLTPFNAQKLVAEGWNKNSIHQHIAKNARVPLFRYSQVRRNKGTAHRSACVLATADLNNILQVPFINQLGKLLHAVSENRMSLYHSSSIRFQGKSKCR